MAALPKPTAPGKASTGPAAVPPTRLNDHCMRAMSEQASCTIGLLPAVEPSLSLRHRPLEALFTRYLPAAAVDAVNVQVWLVLPPHVYCHNWVPDAVVALGTSTHLPLLTLASAWPPFCAATRNCWWVAVAQATWTSGALLDVAAPLTSRHLPLAPPAIV